MTLEEAFNLVDSVHAMIVDSSSHHVNYLQLQCLGVEDCDGTGALWAASFDSDTVDGWYEANEIGKYRFAARAATKEEAIEQAAKKVIAAYERGELKGSLADYELNPNLFNTKGQ